MSDEQNKPAPEQAEVLGVAVVLFTRENGKVTQHQVPLTHASQKTVYNFLKHKLCGGRIQLEKVPSERRIITGP